jgi:hypothetical protein
MRGPRRRTAGGTDQKKCRMPTSPLLEWLPRVSADPDADSP